MQLHWSDANIDNKINHHTGDPQEDDGCGATISCGVCTTGTNCAADGMSCIPACIPKASCSVGSTCGVEVRLPSAVMPCAASTKVQQSTASRPLAAGTFTLPCQHKTTRSQPIKGILSCTVQDTCPLLARQPTASPCYVPQTPQDDGCGGDVACGECADDHVCNGNKCELIVDLEGDPGCTPLAQADACAGLVCGAASDGCNGSVACGTCAPGSSCAADGTVCVPEAPTCLPKTVCDAGLVCGTQVGVTSMLCASSEGTAIVAQLREEVLAELSLRSLSSNALQVLIVICRPSYALISYESSGCTTIKAYLTHPSAPALTHAARWLRWHHRLRRLSLGQGVR